MLSSDMLDFPLPPPNKVGWPWHDQPLVPPDRMEDGRNWPKISIVTPSFNQGPYVEETIRSVLLQGYPNLEYIIIDGGSTDESIEIFQKYDPWLTFWVSEADEGQADAIGKGFQRATGEILAWINSDDYYEANALVRIAGFFSDHKDMVFVNGDINEVGQESQFKRRIYAIRPSSFFASNYGVHGWPQQGCFWRTSTYVQVGGINPSLQFCMDKDLFIRLARAGSSRRIPGPSLANFRIHEQAKSIQLYDTGRTETADIIKKYGQQPWVSHPRLMRTLWWFYRKQAAVRMRLERYFGWEI